MKHILTATILSIPCSIANAGFVTGVIVGSVLSSTPSPSSGPSDAIISDSFDVIACCKESQTRELCKTERHLKNGEYTHTATPLEYAKKAGYSVLHKVAFLPRPSGCDMILMEVSK